MYNSTMSLLHHNTVVIKLAFLLCLMCLYSVLVACSEDHTEWCDAMMLKPNSEWVDPEFEQFAERCLAEE